jgi:hypothetical protein
MQTAVHNADYWRSRAKDVRIQAEESSNAEVRRELLLIAEAYERLAVLAEDGDLY